MDGPVPFSLLEDDSGVNCSLGSALHVTAGAANASLHLRISVVGVRCTNEGGEPLPGAASGEGGGDRRAEGGEEQHPGSYKTVVSAGAGTVEIRISLIRSHRPSSSQEV